jgi:hypothetical protein
LLRRCTPRNDESCLFVNVHDPEASSHPFFQVLFLEEGAGGKEGFIYFATDIASNDGASILST